MKTIITTMLAAASILATASAADSAYANFFNASKGSGVTSATLTLSNGVTATQDTGTEGQGGGYLFGATDSTTWTNSAALEDLNTTLRLSLTTDDLSQYTRTGWSTAASGTLTLDYSGSSDYTLGTEVTIYITVGTADSSLTSALTTSGLDSVTISYATATSDGYSTDVSYTSGANALTLVKITGTLSSTTVTVASSGSNDGLGFGLVAVSGTTIAVVVPEPATATLSLLALAGLAARRRRK